MQADLRGRADRTPTRNESSPMKSSFKSGKHFFIVRLPDGTETTFVGGQSEPGRPGHVWLCHGNGTRVVELPENCVRELIKMELAQRIADEVVKSRGRN